MSSSAASRTLARSGVSVDGADIGGSSSERTSGDGHGGESNGGQVDDTTGTVGEHSDTSSSSSDGAQSQHDSEGEERALQESDAEDTASEGGGGVSEEDTDAEDAASNNSGRGSSATDASSDTSEHSSDAGTENNDSNSRMSSDNGRTSQRHSRRLTGGEETEENRENGRSGSWKSGNSSSSDSGAGSKGRQNEEADEKSFPASNDERGWHLDRADEDGMSSEVPSHDEEERLAQERSDGDDTGDDEQSDDDFFVGTKTNNDDDDNDGSAGEGSLDQEAQATAARTIQRRVRSRTTRDVQPRHKAATKIQATARGRNARRNRSNGDRLVGTNIDQDNDGSRGEGGSDLEEKASAARTIQRRVRSRTTKARADREMQSQHTAATKIQATARGRHERFRNRSKRDLFGTKVDHDDDDDDIGGKGSPDQQEQAAARTIQHKVRSRKSKARTDGDREMQPRHKAATKIQATARGRRARQNHRSRLESVNSGRGSSDIFIDTNTLRAVEDDKIVRRTRNLDSLGTEEASARESSDRDYDDDDDGLVETERDCKSTNGLNLIEGGKLLEQHAARRIQRHARQSWLGGEKATCTQISSKPSAELERKSANRDIDVELLSRRVPTKSSERDARGTARRGTSNEDRQRAAGDSGAPRSKVPMGEDEAARCLQREVRRGSASKTQQRGEVRGEAHGTRRKAAGLGKGADARCNKANVRRGHARRGPIEDRIERKTDGAWRNEAGDDTDGRFFVKADGSKAGQHPPTSTTRTEMNIRGHGLHPDRAAGDVQPELTVEHLGAPQQQPQQQQQQLSGFISPGKAAAAAASAVAKSAAAAAAAAVKAAEAAADAAEAAEAAAEAEEEWSPSVVISSPPVGRNARRKPSPARSAFWLTEGDKDGPKERRDGGNTKRTRPCSGDSAAVEAADKGVDGEGRKRSPRQTRGHDQSASGRDDREEADGKGVGSEEAKLKHAREQAKRHARDRRARAMAKEEDSRRELRAVHADLVKAEKLRNEQANAEKSVLEAKRARVLDDMNRRQKRLQRLRREEEALLDRGGNSNRRSSSRSSSADAAVESKPTRFVTNPKRLGGGAGDGDGDEEDTFSLPRISGGGDGGRQRRRKPRHVSTFRERILEERRVRKEVDALKRKVLEEKQSRQTEYAAKIRAQAKRVLAAEQRRAREDADRSARAHRSGQSVDRTPIAIKKPKQEGEWGVYSYPPDRPPDGLAATKTSVSGGGGVGGSNRRPGSGYGSTGRVRHRLSSSELNDRMRRERERATDVGRARPVGRARAAGARAAAVEAEAVAGRGGRGYGCSEDGAGGRLRAGFRRSVGGDVGDGADGNRRVEGEGVYHHRRPAPPTEQRGMEERLGYGQARSGDSGGGGGRKLGVARSGTRSGGGGAKPDRQRQRPAASNDIHAMYEERLAALERRLVRASSGPRSFPDGGGGSAVGSDSSVAIERRGAREETRTRKSPLPLCGGGEWGAENNPFGYRESPAEHGRGGFARRPDYGGDVNGGGSTSGREVEVEGLSTMYMGPIAHKMARLRATNKA